MAAFSSVYLEDSYVLDIRERPGELGFRLEVVLTESRSAHQPPKPGEQYCYARAWLIFANVVVTKWLSRSSRGFTDSTGEKDLGNIDYFSREADSWLLGGEWGEVRVHTTTEPTLTLD